MFTNQVHEQCLKICSGIVLSQTVPKTGRVHQVHSPGHPARPAHVPRALHGPSRAPAASALRALGTAVALPAHRCRAPRASLPPTPRALRAFAPPTRPAPACPAPSACLCPPARPARALGAQLRAHCPRARLLRPACLTA